MVVDRRRQRQQEVERRQIFGAKGDCGAWAGTCVELWPSRKQN